MGFEQHVDLGGLYLEIPSIDFIFNAASQPNSTDFVYSSTISGMQPATTDNGCGQVRASQIS
jgi:hypothetical protein